ncbi:DUF748 domain-containing protein [Sulfurospirillum barnesii]|uniref:Uncharacterized protein involved in outer membrane biogenesis n=1 Tax=Sulfurospirillum barnesii (strain ATCC 700032 / DSM 10660 / SES-3) TaxID=760154 RepID=I3XUA2_SULBS|nr:DUF748 domain-containing protein [Sulfurospirillum barnesii]AFL67526.1 uncharacterized protein involved in outer membrane biogenesis [Sulfurospirillum barnesii SES-3]
MKKPFKFLLFWLISLSLFYTLSGFIIIPWWIKNQLPLLLKEKTSLPIEIEKVHFNPFTFELHVNNLILKDSSNTSVSRIENLYLNYEPLFLFKKQFYIQTILLDKPFLDLSIDHNGTLNLLSLLTQPSAKEPYSKTNLLMPLIIEHIEFQNARIDFTDARHEKPFHVSFSPINYVINTLSFYKDDLSIHALKIALENEEKISLASSLSIEPLRLHGELLVHDLALKSFWHYLLPTRAHLSEGTLSVRLPFLIDLSKDEPLFFIEKAHVDLKNILFLDQGKKIVSLPSLRVEGIDAELHTSSLRIEKLIADAPFIETHLDHTYTPTLLTLFNPTLPQSTSDKPSNAPKPAWKFSLKSCTLHQASLIILDENVKSKPISFSSLNLHIANITHQSDHPISYELTTTLDKNASIALKGSYVPLTHQSTLDLEAKALPLDTAQPYLTPFTTLTLHEGLLSLRGKVDVLLREKPRVLFKGDLELSKFTLLDHYEQILLYLEHFRMDAIDYVYAPVSSLHVKKILVRKPYVNLDIKKDQSTNFSHLIVLPKNTSHAQKEPMHIVIENMAMNQGSAHFKDASLPIPFATYVSNLNGTVSTLNTKTTKPSVLALEGKVDKYGYAKIDGSVLPFDFKNRATLKIIFKNLDMKSFTPYSGKFVGYAIQEGKLSMDLSYKIRKGLMQGDNQINLDALTLGEKIESKDAIDLPLGLAIALLKDSQGHIELNLPISGDMNSPEFSYSSIVWRAVGNLMGSIVTSPFTLLGSILGIETENLTHIDFLAGKSALIPSEEEKMENYQQILEKKPELKLHITPSFDLFADTKALQENHVKVQLEALMAKNNPLAKNYSKAIQTLFIQAHSKELYEELTQSYTEQKLDRGTINEYLLKKISETVPISPEALSVLAHQRADAIIQNLIIKHKIAPERLLKQDIKKSDALREKWVGCPISLGN